MLFQHTKQRMQDAVPTTVHVRIGANRMAGTSPRVTSCFLELLPMLITPAGDQWMGPGQALRHGNLAKHPLLFADGRLQASFLARRRGDAHAFGGIRTGIGQFADFNMFARLLFGPPSSRRVGDIETPADLGEAIPANSELAGKAVHGCLPDEPVQLLASQFSGFLVHC